MNKIAQMIQDAKEYSFLFVGLFYKWGGDDPSGFDCSGLVIEILRSVGVLPRRGDWTAHAIYHRFSKYKVDTPEAGCLAFWWDGEGRRVIHVEFCIDEYRAVGASGGGSATFDLSSAMRHNAFIKVRPINRDRCGELVFINPFLGELK
jgi:hypothetical protein